MKKIYLSLAFGAFLMLASCKKDYTCTCSDYAVMVDPWTSEETYDFLSSDSRTISTKGGTYDAENSCKVGDYYDGNIKRECQIQ
jgi:hypothetical protein